MLAEKILPLPYTTLFRSCARSHRRPWRPGRVAPTPARRRPGGPRTAPRRRRQPRSEEHTSELQSRRDLVCRLLLEKKKKILTKFARASADNDAITNVGVL